MSDPDKAPDNPRCETHENPVNHTEEWGDWVGVGPSPLQQVTVSNSPEESPLGGETATEKPNESSPPTSEDSQEPIAPSHVVIVLEPAPDPEINKVPVSVEGNDTDAPAPTADVETVQEVEPAKVEEAKEESEAVEPVVPALEPSSHQDEPAGEIADRTNDLGVSAADELSNVRVVPDVEEIALEPVPSVEAEVEVGSEIAEEAVEPKSEVKPAAEIGEPEKPVDAEEKSAQVGDSPHEG